MVDYSDIFWQHNSFGGDNVFECPVCAARQTLSGRNEILRANYASRVKRKQED